MQKAISLYGESLQFRVEWHPYMIDINTSTEGEEYMAYNERRWGGDGWVYDMKRQSKNGRKES